MNTPNLALGKSVVQSSYSENNATMGDCINSCCSTSLQPPDPQPFIVLDLRKIHLVLAVRVFNTRDGDTG